MIAGNLASLCNHGFCWRSRNSYALNVSKASLHSYGLLSLRENWPYTYTFCIYFPAQQEVIEAGCPTSSKVHFLNPGQEEKQPQFMPSVITFFYEWHVKMIICGVDWVKICC